MPRPTLSVANAYDMPCRCGRPLCGQRQSTRQIVSCSHCGHKTLLFPRSPWLASPETPPGQPKRFALNRLLLFALIGGALAMVLVFLLVRPYLRHPLGSTQENVDRQAPLEAGERELHEGNVHLALQKFNAALARHEGLSRAERHRLEQMRRQSDLLAHLLDVPLEDIVHQAMQHPNDEEWRAKFEDYRGRTVIFDDLVRRDGRGRPSLGVLLIRVGDREARVALEDLTLVRQFPHDPPLRWIFGARLAHCRREDGGIWVLGFEPDSTVLLTDADAASVCCPLPLDEATLAVLKLQRTWLARQEGRERVKGVRSLRDRRGTLPTRSYGEKIAQQMTNHRRRRHTALVCHRFQL
jgi:DNA-directed RNA polymerase subunit RPC12/RpoP